MYCVHIMCTSDWSIAVTFPENMHLWDLNCFCWWRFAEWNISSSCSTFWDVLWMTQRIYEQSWHRFNKCLAFASLKEAGISPFEVISFTSTGGCLKPLLFFNLMLHIQLTFYVFPGTFLREFRFPVDLTTTLWPQDTTTNLMSYTCSPATSVSLSSPSSLPMEI